MKVNVTIAGASYSEVPSILIPLKTAAGHGSAKCLTQRRKPPMWLRGKSFIPQRVNW